MRPETLPSPPFSRARMKSDAFLPLRTTSSGNSRSRGRGRADTILILFQDFAAGGTERIMVRLANIWARERRVIIFCGSREGPAAADVSDQVEIVEAAPRIPRSLWSRFLLGRQFTRAVEHLRPDVIVGPGNHVLPVLAPMRDLGIPVVCKLSNPIGLPIPAGLPPAVERAIQRTVFARIARVVAMSPALRAEAARLLPPRKVAVIPEPILAQGCPVDAVPPREGPLRLLFAGRLVAQKNPLLVIRTFALLPDSARLTIVGSGPLERKVMALADRLGVSHRIRFTGQVGGIGPYLAQNDVLILPSRYEGYPAVLVEALAAGVPVVTTRCSASLDEILHHPSFGRIVDADARDLAHAVLSSFASPPPDRTARIALADCHRTETNARAWLDCLDAAAAEASAR
jgi:glycosyltransferase involved in cell wall biosynthesis